MIAIQPESISKVQSRDMRRSIFLVGGPLILSRNHNFSENGTGLERCEGQDINKLEEAETFVRQSRVNDTIDNVLIDIFVLDDNHPPSVLESSTLQTFYDEGSSYCSSQSHNILRSNIQRRSLHLPLTRSVVYSSSVLIHNTTTKPSQLTKPLAQGMVYSSVEVLSQSHVYNSDYDMNMGESVEEGHSFVYNEERTLSYETNTTEDYVAGYVVETEPLVELRNEFELYQQNPYDYKPELEAQYETETRVTIPTLPTEEFYDYQIQTQIPLITDIVPEVSNEAIYVNRELIVVPQRNVEYKIDREIELQPRFDFGVEDDKLKRDIDLHVSVPVIPELVQLVDHQEEYQTIEMVEHDVEVVLVPQLIEQASFEPYEMFVESRPQEAVLMEFSERTTQEPQNVVYTQVLPTHQLEVLIDYQIELKGEVKADYNLLSDLDSTTLSYLDVQDAANNVAHYESDTEGDALESEVAEPVIDVLADTDYIVINEVSQLEVPKSLDDVVFPTKKKKKADIISRSKPIIPYRVNEEEKVTKPTECVDPSGCFAETMDWLEEKLQNPTLTNEEYESVSECFADDIENIIRARKYIKERKSGNVCGGSLRDLFHHDDPRYKLQDYVRNGEVQKGFKLAERLIVGDSFEDMETIEAYNTKTGEKVSYRLAGNTLYAYLNRHMKGTIIWKDFSFIDTDTGEERTGTYWDQNANEMKSCLYLETIAEYHVEAKETLGDKDEHGMKLNGIIILINGKEPGEGTTSLFNYKIKSGDVIEVVYKNDDARYEVKPQPSPIMMLKAA